MPSPLYVGALFPLFSSLKYLDTPTAALLAFHEINANPTILPDYTLILVTSPDGGLIDTDCNRNTAMIKLLNQTSDPQYQPMVGILGAGCSSASMGAAAISAMNKIPQISQSSTSSTLSDIKNYPYFSRVIVSEAYGGAAIATLLDALSFNRVAILFNTQAYSLSIFDNLDQTIVDRQLNIDYLAIPYPQIDPTFNDAMNEFINGEDDSLIPRDQWDCNVTRSAADCDAFHNQLIDRRLVFEKILSNMRATHHKVFLALAQGASDRLFIMEAAANLNMNSNDYTFLFDGDATGINTFQARTYHGVVQTPQKMISYKPVIDESGDVAAFEAAFAVFDPDLRLTPYDPDRAINKWAKYTYDAAYALAYALDNVTDVTDGDAVNSAIRSLDFVGATGRIDFEENGDRLSDLEFVTHANNEWTAKATYMSADKTIDIDSLPSLFPNNVIPLDSFPPSTPSISAALSSSSSHLSLAWGEIETFSVPILSMSLSYVVDSSPLPPIALPPNATQHTRAVSPSSTACAKLTVTTRGGSTSSPLTCDTVPEAAGLGTSGIAAIVTTFVVMFSIFAYLYRRTYKEKQSLVHDAIDVEKRHSHFVVNMTSEQKQLQGEVALLENSLRKIKAYSDKEKKLIEKQVEEFKQQYAQSSTSSDIDKLLLDSSEVIMDEVLGKGAFGEVYKATYRGQVVAVKTMLAPDDDNLKKFRAEILLLGGLHHANIVVLVGACWSTELMALVMEFCERGESSAVMKASGEDLGWDDPLLMWMTDIAKAVQYLHCTSYVDGDGKKVVGIMHRDLKPDNCLVSSNWGVKVCDFGEARSLVDEEEKTLTVVGTPLYVAPEIFKGDVYTTKCDVYSFALTGLVFGIKGRMKTLPWLTTEFVSMGGTKSRTVSIGRIQNALAVKEWRPSRSTMEDTLEIPGSVVDMIIQCWSPNPDDRPEMAEVVDFLETTARSDVPKTTGNSAGVDTLRRVSTGGSLAIRISRRKGEEKETGEEVDWKGKCEELERENRELRGSSK